MEPVQSSNWLQSCALLYRQGNTTDGLVNRLGELVNVWDNNTWGISRAACYQYCGANSLHAVRKPTAYHDETAPLRRLKMW